jgi:hypothetical protein
MYMQLLGFLINASTSQMVTDALVVSVLRIGQYLAKKIVLPPIMPYAAAHTHLEVKKISGQNRRV